VEQIPPEPPVSPTPRPNWWKRNWKWFVPLGCFSIALLFVVFVGSVVVIVFSAVKSTDVYKDALTRAKSHPAVIEALGSPVTEGFLVSGNTNLTVHLEKRIWQFPSPVQKEKVQFTWLQKSPSVDGNIRDSFSKSQTPINESIFSDRRRERIRNNKGAKRFARFTSGTAHVRFMYVDLRGTGKERAEVGEISGI